jgi:uncharacterized protein YdhG (YjbR/CyaY superfamily)
MQSKAENVETYLSELPEDRKLPMQKLRKAILDNLPEGFSETMSYGMIGYVVPHSIYPDGYHCTPKLPLPFINIASQKNNISIYHMGIYANKDIYDWFCEEYAKVSKAKLDIGKSCIRFKKLEQIPYELLGKLVSKMSVEEYIAYYEQNFKKK